VNTHPSKSRPCIHFRRIYLTCGVTQDASDLDCLGWDAGIEVLTAATPMAHNRIPIRLEGIDA